MSSTSRATSTRRSPHVCAVAAERGLSGVAAVAGRVGARAADGRRTSAALGPPPAPPGRQARLRGRLHSQLRDRQAISHHYDLSNEFYALILDPTWRTPAATGAPTTRRTRWRTRSATSSTWSAASSASSPGMRLLDVGCGWGSLSLHAAEHFGARVTGVTIAAEQKRFIDAPRSPSAVSRTGSRSGCRTTATSTRRPVRRGRVDRDGRARRRGATTRRTPRCCTTRCGPAAGCSSSRCRGAGRMPGGGPFIESFIAPDMHMRPVGETVGLLEGGGLEVRDVHALREHYVRTVGGVVRHVRGQPRAARSRWSARRSPACGGSTSSAAAMAFRDGRMGVDQILRCARAAHRARCRERPQW